MGIRASQIRKYNNIGYCGETLTNRDTAILSGLLRNDHMIREDVRFTEELQSMTTMGKYELQWLYGHEEGTSFLQTFVLNAILQGDYL